MAVGMNDVVGTTPSMGDADLVARIAAGDSGAENEFAVRYLRGIRTLVRRHARTADPIVDDLVQEVLQHVLCRLREGALRDAGALPAYVRSAVVFTTTAEYRRRGRRGEESLGDDFDPPGDEPEPSELVEQHQTRACVKLLLAELPTPRDREVLRRFYLDEQPKSAVCAALQIDESHFHRVVFRARERLRALLQQSGLEFV